MRVPIAPVLIAIAATLSACRSSPKAAQHYALLDLTDFRFCDDSAKHPAGRAAIPDVAVAAAYGSITGIVFRAGTDNGVAGASVMLSGLDSATKQSFGRQTTGADGGFAFDSIVPGRYRLRVLAARAHPESASVSIAPNRIDTVHFAVDAPALCGRP
jgi:hypothetical protein